jgi:hypothetical protein
MLKRSPAVVQVAAPTATLAATGPSNRFARRPRVGRAVQEHDRRALGIGLLDVLERDARGQFDGSDRLEHPESPLEFVEHDLSGVTDVAPERWARRRRCTCEVTVADEARGRRARERPVDRDLLGGANTSVPISATAGAAGINTSRIRLNMVLRQPGRLPRLPPPGRVVHRSGRAGLRLGMNLWDLPSTARPDSHENRVAGPTGRERRARSGARREAAGATVTDRARVAAEMRLAPARTARARSTAPG